MKKIFYFIILIIVIFGVVFFAMLVKGPKKESGSSGTPNSANQQYEVKTAEVELTTPLANAPVTSPLKVEGKVKGSWFFEASFPIKVLDQDGTVLGSGEAKAKGDWMTADFVEFSATIIFTAPKGSKGVLVLHNDNPSGLPQNDKEMRVPVNFTSPTSQAPTGVCEPGVVCSVEATGTKMCLENNQQILC